MVTLSTLQTKQIVSMDTGARIGHVIDLEIDVETGLITDIIIGNRSSVSHIFQKQTEVIVPWKNIVTFGHDVILVNEKS
ncbi:YlmC/YmxH family sporulation protein [Amphibacillus cookii]|uniref:YlmC/YmxH family sporulation protein n=1 Tax=Amphibacillus cookii TaxID=767787 RepID=UPI001957D37B|nr:YlmC/YmxH family sporulation protein [Amphibacillus cookii]MBM7540495.1 YlmC/YmxH family sporulation protein [Amphibacillus cookii]